MTPALSVLQLDTHFPRIPGDVASPDTYATSVEFLRIPAASVGKIVTDNPEKVDISPFENAVRNARSNVIATSCGFLAHWQDHLQTLTDRPFVASALVALRTLETAPDRTMTLTFDAQKLSVGHKVILGDYQEGVVGLAPNSHLRKVIEIDAGHLNAELAQQEICDLLARHLSPNTETLILECTNLPPYKPAMRRVFGGRIIDILTEIEARRSGTVRPEFL